MRKDENNLYWIWLSERFGIASKAFVPFIEAFKSPFDIYRMTEEEIEQTEGIDTRLKDALCNKALESAYSILKWCHKNGVDIIAYGSDMYPERLKSIENPPILLYCKGKIPNMNSKLCIAVVGTRKMSEYGRQSAYKISYELASAGVCVVSGMALGVDGVSACGAMEAGGTTVAVLGSGIGRVYPREHERLMQGIIRNGAVISEYPPLSPPNAEHFPTRNRIISGLCQATLVIEAAQRSGALITASRAMAQGREVFALPGKVSDVHSAGTNELIRSGANIALCAQDIIEHYDFLYHNAISYDALHKAKSRSELREQALSFYGVCMPQNARRGHRKEVPQKPLPNTETEKNKAENTKNTADAEKKTAYDGLDALTRRVYDAMGAAPVSPDAIAIDGAAIGDVITSLTLLEIAGLAASVPGGMFKKI